MFQKNNKIDVKQIIIKNVDDGNNEYRKYVSMYDLLMEIGITAEEIPKCENDIIHVEFKRNQKMIINGFQVEILLVNFGHLCGYVKKYVGDTDLINMDKYKLLTCSNGELSLEEVEDIYYPHGGYTHYNGFDCHHYNDIALLDIIINEKMGISHFLEEQHDDPSFKSFKFVLNELNKIVDSLIELLKK